MLRERFELEADALWAHLQVLARKKPELEALYARDADPRVARLVQSAAFAFSVAQNRLDDDAQALVRPLVARALPESLRPRPSSTILEVSGLRGHAASEGTASFDARVGQKALPFRLVWPAGVSPVALEGVVLDRVDARRQVLRFALVARGGVSLAAALPRSLRLFVNLEPRSVALDLLHALRSSRSAGRTKWVGPKGALIAEHDLPADAVSWVRVDTEERPLVSARADRFKSSSLLGDLFVFPESFCFFDLRLARCDAKTQRIEVVLPLAHLVEDASGLADEHLRLYCAPATNEFVSAIERVERASATEATLSAVGRPHAEILEVRHLWTTSARAALRTALRSWECPDGPRTFDPDEVHYALEQRASAEDGRTELRARFGRLTAFPSPAGGVVEGEVLACDGALTANLGLGDVGSPVDGATNITRVTPSRRAILGQNYAWRMSAYARMPPARLAARACLTDFLDLHDLFGAQDEALRIRRPRVLATEHALEHELTDGVLGWGDRFVVDLDPGGCRDGESWLLGTMVHRALCERSEALRTTRLELRRNGAPFAEYAPRPGARLPFPLG